MFQRRLVTLWAWLMRFPACGFLPQISHCCAMTTPRLTQKDKLRSCEANLDFTGGCAVSASSGHMTNLEWRYKAKVMRQFDKTSRRTVLIEWVLLGLELEIVDRVSPA